MGSDSSHSVSESEFDFGVDNNPHDLKMTSRDMLAVSNPRSLIVIPTAPELMHGGRD